MATKNTLEVASRPKESFSAFMANPAVKQKIYEIVAGKDGDKFITAIVTAVGVNPSLAACKYQSILTAALLGEALKLSPSPQLGQYYMVPYNDKDMGKVAQFQLGYKGYIQLAIRSGEYRDIDVICVKETELVSYNPFTKKAVFNAIENPSEREAARTIGYFGYFELINGYRKELYWSKEQMQAHAEKYSQGYAADLKNKRNFTFWSKNFDAMAQKTLLRQLLSKYGPLSIDRHMQQAYESDMGYIRSDGSVAYIDGTDTEVFKDVTTADTVAKPNNNQRLPEVNGSLGEEDDEDVSLPFNLDDTPPSTRAMPDAVQHSGTATIEELSEAEVEAFFYGK